MGANIFIRITKYSIDHLEVFKTCGTFAVVVMEKNMQIESVTTKVVDGMVCPIILPLFSCRGGGASNVKTNFQGKSTYVVTVPGCVLLYSKKAVSSVCFGGCTATSDSVPSSKMTYCCSGR